VDPPLWAWAALILGIPVLAAIDLLVFGRGERDVPVRKAALWSACWVALGFSFAAVLGLTMDGTSAGEYLAGYLIEWSLSIDNLFVFAVIFSYFSVPSGLQPRVLMFGVLGALIFRGIFIAIGAAALSAAGWVIYIFGAFLLVTAYRLGRSTGESVDPSKNKLLLLVRRYVPSTHDYRGTRVFVREGGRRLATPIFTVLVVVASTDVVFALDSIPAIFAVTDQAFIVLAANAFAVMGLRATYFVIVGALTRFRYLNYGLAAVLGFVGIKMILSDVYHPPVYLTLGAVAVILGIAILASLWATRGQEPPPGVGPTPAVGVRERT
jgi:tellurite resistance protein TerC